MIRIFLSTLLVGAMVGCGASGPKPYAEAMLPAHRGESYDAPENTLAAYRLAWERGETAVEVDVDLTRDGLVVLMHDADTFRTSGKKVKLVVKDATLAEIQRVDVGSGKGPQWAGEKAPTLREIYEAMPEGSVCYTEIKGNLDVVPAVANLVKETGKRPEEVVIISFKADVLEASKKALPEHKHYFLAAHRQDQQGNWQASPNVDEWIAIANRINADGLDLRAVEPLNQTECRKILDSGLELHVWTVNDPAVAKRYLDWGAMSVTTDRPSWMRQELAKFDR